MTAVSFNGNDKVKIRELVDSGVGILQQIDDLKASLKDAVKTLAEELNVQPSSLNKAIAASFKGNIADAREAIDEVELIMHAAGRL